MSNTKDFVYKVHSTSYKIIHMFIHDFKKITIMNIKIWHEDNIIDAQTLVINGLSQNEAAWCNVPRSAFCSRLKVVYCWYYLIAKSWSLVKYSLFVLLGRVWELSPTRRSRAGIIYLFLFSDGPKLQFISRVFRYYVNSLLRKEDCLNRSTERVSFIL